MGGGGRKASIRQIPDMWLELLLYNEERWRFENVESKDNTNRCERACVETAVVRLQNE